MSLEKLDLSGNNITNVSPLSALRLLSVLNLSANRISNLGKISGVTDLLSPCSISVVSLLHDDDIHVFVIPFVFPEPLHSCESLQHLNVAGNIISRYIPINQMI